VPDPDPVGGSLRPLWAAGAVAVVGAGERPDGPGHLVVRHLLRFGYRGRILPVHPHATAVLGLPAYPSVSAAAATGPIDLAFILVRADAAEQAVAECAKAGAACAIVGASGFAETGSGGLRVQEEMVAAARAAGMRLIGPNCIGAAGFATGQVASFSPLFGALRPPLPAGGIGFASTSGALGYGAVSLAVERGLGMYAAVTTGNEADVTALEALAALAAEPSTTALLGLCESVTDVASLRALAAGGKPAALLVAGGSRAGARAAASHTGALTTDERVVAGALRQLGIAQVSDVDDLLDVGDAFEAAAATGRWPRPPGDRVAVVTTSGGSGILAADAIEAYGLRLAELAPSTLDTLRVAVPDYGSVVNPVDVTATVMRDRTLVARCLEAVADDLGVDQIIACFCVLTGDDVGAIVEALTETGRRSGKPVLVARTGADALAPEAGAALRAAGVPAYPTPRRAIRAAAALHLVATAPATRPTPSGAGHQAGPNSPTPTELGGEGQSRDEAAVKAWLAAAGVPVPRGRVVHDADAATAAVRECGATAVLKAVLPGEAHKTERGGVVLGVAEPDAAATFVRLNALPGASGVLVEELVPPGVEVLVGFAPSPLGRVLTLGAGGVLAEALDDVAVRLLPVTDADVRDALGQTRVARLLNGFRSTPPADVDALVAVIVRLARLAEALPPDAVLDLNPVVAGSDRAVVLDAALTAAPIGES
jgi:acyl-CoA synthetase (NDP forming)